MRQVFVLVGFTFWNKSKFIIWHVDFPYEELIKERDKFICQEMTRLCS